MAPKELSLYTEPAVSPQVSLETVQTGSMAPCQRKGRRGAGQRTGRKERGEGGGHCASLRAHGSRWLTCLSQAPPVLTCVSWAAQCTAACHTPSAHPPAWAAQLTPASGPCYWQHLDRLGAAAGADTDTSMTCEVTCAAPLPGASGRSVWLYSWNYGVRGQPGPVLGHWASERYPVSSGSFLAGESRGSTWESPRGHCSLSPVLRLTLRKRQKPSAYVRAGQQWPKLA